MEIRAGVTITGPKWPEPVEVKVFEDLGDYVRIVGSTAESHEHIDQLIGKEELSRIEIATLDLDFQADPVHTFLSLEALRYRFASMYDPLLAMNTSKVDPLPH